jgi:hypothetical protein
MRATRRQHPQKEKAAAGPPQTRILPTLDSKLEVGRVQVTNWLENAEKNSAGMISKS